MGQVLRSNPSTILHLEGSLDRMIQSSGTASSAPQVPPKDPSRALPSGCCPSTQHILRFGLPKSGAWISGQKPQSLLLTATLPPSGGNEMNSKGPMSSNDTKGTLGASFLFASSGVFQLLQSPHPPTATASSANDPDAKGQLFQCFPSVESLFCDWIGIIDFLEKMSKTEQSLDLKEGSQWKTRLPGAALASSRPGRTGKTKRRPII